MPDANRNLMTLFAEALERTDPAEHQGEHIRGPAEHRGQPRHRAGAIEAGAVCRRLGGAPVESRPRIAVFPERRHADKVSGELMRQDARRPDPR